MIIHGAAPNIDSQHPSDEPSSFDLPDVLEVGDQADDAATFVAGCEVANAPARPPVTQTLNDPEWRSARHGLSATYSRPTILPPGNKRLSSGRSAGIASRAISPKSIVELLPLQPWACSRMAHTHVRHRLVDLTFCPASSRCMFYRHESHRDNQCPELHVFSCLMMDTSYSTFGLHRKATSSLYSPFIIRCVSHTPHEFFVDAVLCTVAEQRGHRIGGHSSRTDRDRRCPSWAMLGAISSRVGQLWQSGSRYRPRRRRPARAQRMARITRGAEHHRARRRIVLGSIHAGVTAAARLLCCRGDAHCSAHTVLR